MGSVVEDFDVIIVGAGLSGLNSAYLLQTTFPDLNYVILESRDIIGGTWAFWKYPGARSDSSSAVFTFSWHSWPHDMNFADAPLIQQYAESAAKAQGIDKRIRFLHRVGDRRWSTAEQLWTVDVADVTAGEKNATARPYRARWLINCSGYYNYDAALEATIPGLKQFRGEVVHPQFWTDDISVDGKNVVVVGSGATAITMLPHIAKRAKHSVMLQRSPSYVLALPRRDHLTALARRWLPRRLVDVLDWYRQIVIEHLFVYYVTTFPNAGRKLLRAQAQKLLPKGYPVDEHFNPKYNPFEQRMCMCPDADFFKALRKPNCEVITDVVETVTEDGIRLKNAGTEIKADMIITATGLQVQILNGRVPFVDGEAVDLSSRYCWRSCMVEGVPNTCFIIGYTTGTWTPGADAHFRTVMGVMKEMRRRGATSATPTVDQAKRASMAKLPVMPNSSGYLVRARDRLPMSSGKYPWTAGLTYFYDTWYNWFGSVKDGMVYTVPDKKKD